MVQVWIFFQFVIFSMDEWKKRCNPWASYNFLMRRGLNQVSPFSPEDKGICNSFSQGNGPKFLGEKWLPRENGPSSWGIYGCLGNVPKFPKETWFPITNGLKFLWKTCSFGSLEQMGLSSPKETCQGNLSPFALKVFWADSPSDHISTRNLTPFVFKNHVLSPYFLGNQFSLRNLSPFALGKLQVPISPRSYLRITFLSSICGRQWKVGTKELNIKPLGWRGDSIHTRFFS